MRDDAMNVHVQRWRDPDQSIYGFNGADSGSLKELAARPDVDPVRLEINYRSAGDIVRVAQRALGEVRGYRALDDKRPAIVRMVKCQDGLPAQAQHAVSKLLAQALDGKAGRQLGDVAILYRTAAVGNVVAAAASAEGIDFIRVDTGAPYRKVSLTSWIEDCSAWCAGGWRQADPTFDSILARYAAFRQQPLTDDASRVEQRQLVEFLWSSRENGPAETFVQRLRNALLDRLMMSEAALSDQSEQVRLMADALVTGGPLQGLDMARLGGRDGSPTHLNLLTLHSAKGCEYDVVIMLGLDEGSFPWRNEKGAQLSESRRLFYVGLTRARDEVHMLYSGWTQSKYGTKYFNGRSRFLDELVAKK
ncbi:ATP-dependent helicase [Caballeronia sp. LjRoot29]|uniref:3'-5' exonuclease n=1 Tax=Caballeronia sp. LjRoot29 TaxID=3342315 RepID=UPI003ECED354